MEFNTTDFNLFEFFDKFGVVLFALLILDSLFYIKTGNADWRVYARLAFGIAGVLVDGFLVFVYS